MGFSGFSLGHLLVVLVIVLLVFGTKRLKNLGGDLGGAIKGFKNALSDDKKDGDNKDQSVVAEQPRRVVEQQDTLRTEEQAKANAPVNHDK